MKRSKTTIKQSDRAAMAMDPFYDQCALASYGAVRCAGSITWEHALVFAGKKIQHPWAIIPLCELHHAVNGFQDAGTMNKELNIWIALNRATDGELKAVSKAEDYIRKREYLNRKYGIYLPRESTYKTVGIAY